MVPTWVYSCLMPSVSLCYGSRIKRLLMMNAAYATFRENEPTLLISFHIHTLTEVKSGDLHPQPLHLLSRGLRSFTWRSHNTAKATWDSYVTYG